MILHSRDTVAGSRLWQLPLVSVAEDVQGHGIVGFGAAGEPLRFERERGRWSHCRRGQGKVGELLDLDF